MRTYRPLLKMELRHIKTLKSLFELIESHKLYGTRTQVVSGSTDRVQGETCIGCLEKRDEQITSLAKVESA